MFKTLLQKIGRGIVLASLCFAIVPVVHAESIENFAVNADLTSDRRLTIEETIDYSFGALQKHGLLRSLPERYKRYGLNYDLHYTIKGVTMDGQAIPWEEEDQGPDLVLKIGDPNVYVTGTHRYVIQYRTDRAINDFTDSQELYWNVTGNEWPVPIERSSFVFQGISTQHQVCYTGRVGATTSACSFRPTSTAGAVIADSPAELGPYEGFTVVLEFPKGNIAPEPFSLKAWYLLVDNMSLLLPLFFCILMIAVWYRWGRDPQGRGVIIPQYEAPDGLTPGLMAGLVEEEISTKAMTATILDLARRGHTKLQLLGKNPEEPEQIIYARLPAPASDALAPYEEELLKAIFGNETEVDLRRTPTQSQWKAYQRVIKTLTDDMLQRGWFVKNPGAVRGRWMAITLFIFIFAFFTGYLFYVVVAVVVGILGWHMPKMTKLAAEVCERILGFKLFLRVTEKDRLAFSYAPEKRPEQFAEFLPAAVALGVEKEWAKQFEGMTVQPPSYIQGAGMHWGSLSYAHALGHVSHSVAAGMAHQTSAGSGTSGFSSGGGSSGGGFGGGGGGSW